jgi:hypothetical protein
MAFAAAHADIIFTAQSDLASTRTFTGRIHELLCECGRKPDDVRVLPGLMPIIGSTEAEAHRLAAELATYVDVETGLIKLAAYMPGVDFRALDLEEPVSADALPDVEQVQVSRSRYAHLRCLAIEQRYTVRQLMSEVTRSHGHGVTVGTPEQVADRMVQWFADGACDGFNLALSHTPGSNVGHRRWLGTRTKAPRRRVQRLSGHQAARASRPASARGPLPPTPPRLIPATKAALSPAIHASLTPPRHPRFHNVSVFCPTGSREPSSDDGNGGTVKSDLHTRPRPCRYRPVISTSARYGARSAAFQAASQRCAR